MTASIISTVETDISGFLTGLPADVVTAVEGLLSDLTGSSNIAALLEKFAYQAVPEEFYGWLLEAFAYFSAKDEQVIAQLPPGTPLVAFLTSEKATIDAAVATRAGSNCARAIPGIVAAGEAFFANPAAPTPASAVSVTTKAVAIKAALVKEAAAPPTYVLTPAEWASILGARQQAAINAAADAPLIPDTMPTTVDQSTVPAVGPDSL